MAMDAKWYARWVRLLPASTADEKMRNLEAADMLEELDNRVPRWISVEERLPEEEQLVLFVPTCNSNSVYVGTLSHVGRRGGVMFDTRYARTTMNYYSRFWMPLPEPPKEE